jgi:hypothetical protein
MPEVLGRHVLLTNDPAAAERLVAALRAASYEPKVDTHDGGWTWIVSVVAPEQAEERVAAVGAADGAAYDGWEPVET